MNWKNIASILKRLSFEDHSDIDGLELFLKLNLLILLTLSMIVAIAKRSFSKLKLIKVYLRSIML